MSIRNFWSESQNVCFDLPYKLIFSSVLLVVVSYLNAQSSVSMAIDRANNELWSRFVDQYGIIHDFEGEIPTPEDCKLGRPNALGWFGPIENGPFFTGLYLSAACERARRSGAKMDRDKAKLLADGLLKCASVSDVMGFVVRGVGTDGQCHYPLGSVDQTIPWCLGLYRYLRSDIPTVSQRQMVKDKLTEVTNALVELDWKLPCDGHFRGEFRGDLKSKNYLEVTAFLFVLRMMFQLTQDRSWLERYQTALFEKPRGSVEQPSLSDKTRIEICSAGYRIDSVIFNGNMDKSAQWIYVKNQMALVNLIELENDETIKENYRAGVIRNAQYAFEAIGDYKKFSNDDTKVFGNTKWREGFPHWFPQITQEDAQKLSSMGNKEKLGERRSYERKFMTNPLAATAIVALGGDTVNCGIIEQIICHYDYSKLNLSEFFFAEVAYYSIPCH